MNYIEKPHWLSQRCTDNFSTQNCLQTPTFRSKHEECSDTSYHFSSSTPDSLSGKRIREFSPDLSHLPPLKRHKFLHQVESCRQSCTPKNTLTTNSNSKQLVALSTFQPISHQKISLPSDRNTSNLQNVRFFCRPCKGRFIFREDFSKIQGWHSKRERGYLSLLKIVFPSHEYDFSRYTVGLLYMNREGEWKTLPTRDQVVRGEVSTLVSKWGTKAVQNESSPAFTQNGVIIESEPVVSFSGEPFNQMEVLMKFSFSVSSGFMLPQHTKFTFCLLDENGEVCTTPGTRSGFRLQNNNARSVNIEFAAEDD